MFKDKSICVVVPAYNESTQIANVIQTMPEFVDKIVVVDDASQDNTVEIVKQQQNEIDKIEIIQHESNQGVGGAISSGYKWARDNECEVTAVMAGDGQMDPTELETIIMPIVDGSADYTKGNRSGYWHVADSQSGYTAISLIALKRINLDKIYPDYGMPNDLLIKLNQHDFRVRDVHIRPVYNVGERSDIKMTRVIPRISWILFKGFWQRLFFKYVVRDFHPLIFFYLLSFFLLSFSVPLAIRLFYIWATRGDIPDMNALALIFTIISGLQTLFFGMWFDMEYNKNLK
jgi:glycosyltransferase involved in cell wall biosynthesis